MALLRSVVLPSLVVALTLGACSSDTAAPAPPVEEQPELLEVPEGGIAIVNVTVVPMTDEDKLEDQIVVLDGDRILHVRAASEVALPEGVETVDGRGKFLMPGLVDMHVHSWFVEEGVLFVANGVTTVRNMFGGIVHIGWRDRFADGSLLGPTLYTAGPIVDGADPVWPGSDVVTDEASAASVVSNQVAAGYDFIKVYSKLTEPAWSAILTEAQAQGIPVAGHIPQDVPYGEALGTWHSINEHLEGFAEAAIGGGLPTDFGDWPAALNAIDPQVVEQLASDTASAGMWNVPTIVVYRNIKPGIDGRPEMKYVHPQWRTQWESAYAGAPPEVFDAYEAMTKAISDWTGALHDAGAPLLAGTDAGNPWVLAGWSLHEELQFFVDAGFEPIEALRAATADAARALGATDEFGTVEVGKRADLLLLDADPTADVANAAARTGLFLRGRWFTAADLQAALDEVAAGYP